MKKNHIKLVILFLLMTIISACQKDKTFVPIENNNQFVDNNNIRILKIDYTNKPFNFNYMPEYIYDSQGFIDSIIMVDANPNPNPNKANWAKVQREDHMISFFSGIGITDYFWNKIQVNTNDNKISNILVTISKALPPHSVSTEEVIIKRDNEKRLRSVEIAENSFYKPICIQINKFNNFNLPEKTSSINHISFNSYHFEFSYEYDKGEKIPSSLKRLMNEELLYLNRYGITNYDEIFIVEEDNIEREVSPYGEGNWLISFGLPQFYILEERSSHIVSKRTTQIFKTNENGEREYVKTIVEDFPYVHNSVEKTLEIAGLKIWYEFLDKE